MVTSISHTSWLSDYQLSNKQLFKSFFCSEYAIRHLNEAKASNSAKHYVIALIEFVPILGGIASLIERLAAKIWKPKDQSKNPLISLPKDETTEIASSPLHENNIDPSYLLDHDPIPTDSPRLHEIQAHYSKQGIPLHVCPKKPTKNYPFKRTERQSQLTHKLNNVEDWYHLDESQYTCEPGNAFELIKKALTAVQYIPMQELEIQLEKCVDTLNKEIGTTSYAIGIIPGKSFQWLASLASKHLEKLPDDWFSFPVNHGITSYLTVDKPIRDVRADVGVIFDDCTYSGEQLMAILYTLDGKKDQFFIVIPFMTTPAKERIENFISTAKSKFTLITSDRRIKTIGETMKDEDELKAFYSITIQHPQLTHYAAFSTKGEYRPIQTLCHTDWRLPDNTSYLTALSNGIMTPLLTKNTNAEDVDFILTGNFNPGTIPRPYQLATNNKK